ncbi:glycoside hydrolase family 92 protein [Patellaria atrata CBS 101060]|uniref:Glycoside hydrolase family 92 protein n=1 Tax=Patellaria atrata CBS 101060 TaxID=1346257 RepID=A0A9P4VIK6_9PEZI|nr:glycoside hydrolase family 92 protein [Patellaria atrata CBS 101060]
MAKAVADSHSGQAMGGFTPDDSQVLGFSHMHDSGTGGGMSMGALPIFITAGCPGDDINRCVFNKMNRGYMPDYNSLSVRPGYFALNVTETTLNTTLRAEMTASNKTALYRFKFPEYPDPISFPNPNTVEVQTAKFRPFLFVDLSDLANTRIEGSASVDAETSRMTASGRFVPSFGTGDYQIYICADVKGAPIKNNGVFINTRAGAEPKSINVTRDGVNNPPEILPAGVWTQFEPPPEREILVRVGLSFVSEEKACANAEREIPDFDFEGTLDTAVAAWEDKLSVVSVEIPPDMDPQYPKGFWSGIYRTMLSPQDYTGENPFWESDEPYYDSFYCIWDSFRSIHPFLTLIDPQAQTDMVRAMIDIYRHEGKLPDCRMSFCKGFTQGGSNADIVLVDAYLKNLTANIDWNTAYEALISDAEDEPPNWAVEGRGGLKSWKELHYIPADDFDPYGSGPFTRSVSRTVEYAYDDFVIGTLAALLGKTEDAAKYRERGTYWRNLFNPTTRSVLRAEDTNFTGFLQPRFANGSWGFQDPARCSPVVLQHACYLNPNGGETYEGPIWLYTLFAPGHMSSLITLLGGPESFVKRLDFMFTSGLLYIGNEVSFLSLFLYHYVGRPGRSTYRVHQFIPAQFTATWGGLPGNDDSGAMGSFQAFAMMGIFPNAGQDVYLITAPFFPEVSVKNPQTGKTATVKCKNWDKEYHNIYIQSAKLDGEVYTKSWLTHKFFLEGGMLELVLGDTESETWGRALEDLPPSVDIDLGRQVFESRWADGTVIRA